MNHDIIEAVQGRLGNAQDNLHRARAAFRGLTVEQMGEQYGESGETRAEVVAGYECEVERWKRALEDAQR